MDDAEVNAHELLGLTEAVRRRTREAMGGRFWFPLVLFGALVIAAAPWYRQPQPAPASCQDNLCVVRIPAGSMHGATVYWVIAVVLGYAATLGYYRWRAARVGVVRRVWPYPAVGLGLLGAMALVVLPVDLSIRGMVPLLALAPGLFVLAWLERSLPLAAFGALFLAVALTSNSTMSRTGPR
ncbi:hypothetical protein GXW82_14195 [Streptacidiphilus sp. 4-A2]|nr:hypothetical protein [Streptacidiphilus sp. 4-A2]